MNKYNKRAQIAHTEKPMSVNANILEICRVNVEPRWKLLARQALRVYFKNKFKLYDLGEGCHLGSNSFVNNAWLGNFSSFGPKCIFNGPTVIGDLTMLSSEVQVIGQDHEFNNNNFPMRASFPVIPRPLTIIESDCWIGSRVTIMEGIRIGRGTIVGAGSVVTKSLPPYSIAAGIPARVLRQRFSSENAKMNDEYLYGNQFTGSKNEQATHNYEQ